MRLPLSLRKIRPGSSKIVMQRPQRGILTCRGPSLRAVSVVSSAHNLTKRESPMDARSPQASRNVTAAFRRGADHIAPDCAGQNFYAVDRGLRDLLPLYLSPTDFARLEPHFDRLGALAGGRLDELARIADRNPPVVIPRDRFGRD